MKHLLFLISTYAFLEVPRYIGVSGLENVQGTADRPLLTQDDFTEHMSVNKRGSPYKRLPAWSIYYGKRSNDEFSNNVDGSPDSSGSEINAQFDDVNDLVKDIAKRPSFKRLHSWMSTYGKRSLDEDNAIISKGGDDFNEPEYNNKYSTDSDFLDTDNKSDEAMYDAEKRVPGWGATYGKRVPGWGATYGKRVPGWGATYGKRVPGWSATYGKRIAGWGATYGKRVPGWSATYGKRVPGWGATYGKRFSEVNQEMQKRIPGWGATYGKRVPGWSATYGKRAAMWQALYGKRPESELSFQDKLNALREQLNPAKPGEYDKRAQWGAFYG